MNFINSDISYSEILDFVKKKLQFLNMTDIRFLGLKVDMI